jgi:hypothetical protein
MAYNRVGIFVRIVPRFAGLPGLDVDGIDMMRSVRSVNSPVIGRGLVRAADAALKPAYC